MAHISIYCGFVSGRQDLPSDVRAFSLTSFKALSFLSRLNKGYNFLPSTFWLWITKQLPGKAPFSNESFQLFVWAKRIQSFFFYEALVVQSIWHIQRQQYENHMDSRLYWILTIAIWKTLTKFTVYKIMYSSRFIGVWSFFIENGRLKLSHKSITDVDKKKKFIS